MCSGLLGHHDKMNNVILIRYSAAERPVLRDVRCIQHVQLHSGNYKNWPNVGFRCHQGTKRFNQPINSEDQEQSRAGIFLLAGGRGWGGLVTSFESYNQ